MLEKRNYYIILDKLLNVLDLMKFSYLWVEVVPYMPNRLNNEDSRKGGLQIKIFIVIIRRRVGSRVKECPA